MTQRKNADKNLALISVILGAASFTTTIFTGIPAIVLGVMSLKRKAGDRTQAKLGIIFGTIGSLLLIPIILLAIHFLRTPFNQQTSVPDEDRRNIVAIADALASFYKENEAYPACSVEDTEQTCAAWQSFLKSKSIASLYPMAFEKYANTVEDRPSGTLVLAYSSTCFINTPGDPNSLKDRFERVNAREYAALVYFHDKGRACFPTKD